jgi:hypothetical protein
VEVIELDSDPGSECESNQQPTSDEEEETVGSEASDVLPTQSAEDFPPERVCWPTPDSSLTSARAMQAEGILAETLRGAIGELREVSRESAISLQVSVERNTEMLAALVGFMAEQNRMLALWTDKRPTAPKLDDATNRPTVPKIDDSTNQPTVLTKSEPRPDPPTVPKSDETNKTRPTDPQKRPPELPPE